MRGMLSSGAAVVLCLAFFAFLTEGRWSEDRAVVDENVYDQYVVDPMVSQDLEDNMDKSSYELNVASQRLRRRRPVRRQSLVSSRPIESWTGKWFPKPPAETMAMLKDSKHGIKMGVSSSFCDDAKTNLTLDWDMSPVNYTCYTPTRLYPVNAELEPLLHCDDVPKGFTPLHFCMNQTITYDDVIPTHGDHRPLWPKFGEYKFVPLQRWLHNIEHGAIVMLYHPCAQPFEIQKLKKLVRNCIRKHIITPYTLLEPERPLALVAWGCHLQMSSVEPKVVQDFIVKHALKGPEGRYAKEGQYDLGLLRLAKPPKGSNFMDSFLCPHHAS